MHSTDLLSAKVLVNPILYGCLISGTTYYTTLEVGGSSKRWYEAHPESTTVNSSRAGDVFTSCKGQLSLVCQ